LLYVFRGGNNGSNPSNIVDVGGTLYGTTNGGKSELGTIYGFDIATGVHKVLKTFRGDHQGAYPGGLTDIGGTIYGYTTYGGDTTCTANLYVAGCGTLFTFTP
jgi:uncharacterized repeat protein (TIGR03803 family)